MVILNLLSRVIILLNLLFILFSLLNPNIEARQVPDSPPFSLKSGESRFEQARIEPETMNNELRTCLSSLRGGNPTKQSVSQRPSFAY